MQILAKEESPGLALLREVPLPATTITTPAMAMPVSSTPSAIATTMSPTPAEIDPHRQSSTEPPVVSIVAALCTGAEQGRLGSDDNGGGLRGHMYVCPHEGCDKAYSRKNYLVEHERLHTGPRGTGTAPQIRIFCLKRFKLLPLGLLTKLGRVRSGV